MYSYMGICIHIHTQMCIHVHTHMNIHTYHREIDRETEGEGKTDRQKETERKHIPILKNEQ